MIALTSSGRRCDTSAGTRPKHPPTGSKQRQILAMPSHPGCPEAQASDGRRRRRGPQIRPTARRADQHSRSAPLRVPCSTSASLAAKLHSPTDAAQRDREQPAHRLGMTLDPAPPALRSTRDRPRTAVRRGASRTAAYHLQLTVAAAVARPVGSSVVPSESLLPSGPGSLLTQMTSAGGASSRHPAVRRRRPGRHHQDASHGIGRRSVSSIGCPPIRYRRPGSGGPAVRCPAVRCPLTWVRRLGSGGPVVCCPPVRGPALWCPPVRCPALRCPPVQRPPRGFGRVRLLPCRAVALGPGRCGGHRHHGNGSSPGGAAAPSSGSVDGRAGLDAAALDR
jgi:hypothetical protein